MNTHFIRLSSIALLIAFTGSSTAFALIPSPFTTTSPADSVGVEKKDGKRFIIHRVDEGQTLFAIARRYKRSVAEIKAANPDLKDAVQYDQVVRIPLPDEVLTRKEAKAIDKAIKKQEKEQKRDEKVAVEKTGTPPTTRPGNDARKTDDPARSGIHVVEAGQTLYSLAVRYGVSQADLRRWNNLPGDNVLIGQALIVSEKAYQARVPSTPVPGTSAKPTDTPARRPDAPATRPASTSESKPERAPTPPDSRRTENQPTASAKPGDKPVEEIELPRPGNDAPMPTRGRRISDSGVAEMIEGSDGSGKYLALHRTAPIGTLVQVRNEFNNQSLWVKVIGRLPNTGINDKILIKLSEQAFAKLSPEDRRFRAEVSYIVK
ncbi:LysM peptidoglycan-binding domain-containing protein [Spirosoma montaniterrae]|uniref:Peptidoglycan-binding protein n=1 Tax=Spirosoma montaniterrae TaxID=1178516 RepID=A0A1P9WSA1_9BACT|nr:LysM peptidoglycan-binding domain-containing protein [Spirosoma montaniterrae]AQG78232.1 peptidoglycan-binding protein [Spirosoma montaniterrae]